MGSGSEASKLGKVTCSKETQKAILVTGGFLEGEVWVPKSVIHDDSEVFDSTDNATGELVVKEWWAEKEGIF